MLGVQHTRVRVREKIGGMMRVICPMKVIAVTKTAAAALQYTGLHTTLAVVGLSQEGIEVLMYIHQLHGCDASRIELK